MDIVGFLFRWNGILQKKQLCIEGVKMNTPHSFSWKREQDIFATFRFTNESSNEARITELQTRHGIIHKSLIIELIHNDTQMATVILTPDESDHEIVCRVGHFTDIGEFNEMFYDGSDFTASWGRVGWSVDEYPEDLFEECC